MYPLPSLIYFPPLSHYICFIFCILSCFFVSLKSLFRSSQLAAFIHAMYLVLVVHSAFFNIILLSTLLYLLRFFHFSYWSLCCLIQPARFSFSFEITLKNFFSASMVISLRFLTVTIPLVCCKCCTISRNYHRKRWSAWRLAKGI